MADVNEPRSYHGTGEQAIQWLLFHSRDSLLENEAFLRAWNEGSAGDEWPDFYEWLDHQPVCEELPQNVMSLVIAAREAFDTGMLPDDEQAALDKALEPFAAAVPYENEPTRAKSEEAARG